MMKGPKQKIFVGDVFNTNFSGDCVVVEYNGSQDILVKFEDGTTTKTYSHMLQAGKVKNLNSPRVFGKGFIGVGAYSAGKTGNITKEYNTWSAMLARCYDTKNQLQSYVDCKVVDSWLNFQVFAEWCNNQPGFSLPNWQLDKDLLVHNNKIYSPETCTFLPRELNVIFRSKKISGNPDLPKGVEFRSGRFVATSSVGGKVVSLGSYGDKFEAFESVRLHVNNKVCSLAEHHKDNLCQKAYIKLISFDYEPY